MIFALAWRNLWRQPVRTALSVFSIAFASALLVFALSFQLGVYDTMKANALRLFDGFAQLQPEGYADDPDIRKTLSDPFALASQAAAVSGVEAAAPRATSYVILANGERSFGAAIVGVDPEREPQVSTLASTVRDGRYFAPADTDSIVLGDALARNLQLSLGDHVTLLGSGLDGSIAADVLTLVGIFHSGISEIDRQIAQMPLKRFQETFAMGDTANVVVLSGKRLADVDNALPALGRLASERGIAARDWGELQPALKQAITLDFTTALLWYASMVVVVVFIILNTLLMSVFERTREFGMLLAVGMRSDLIGRMLWLELVLYALIGNVVGILIGGAAALYFQFHGITFSGLEGIFAEFGLPSQLFPALSFESVLAGPVIIVLSIAVMGYYPYRRVKGLEPVAAMGAA